MQNKEKTYMVLVDEVANSGYNIPLRSQKAQSIIFAGYNFLQTSILSFIYYNKGGITLPVIIILFALLIVCKITFCLYSWIQNCTK